MKTGNSLVMTLPKTICDIFEIEKGKDYDIIATDSGLFIPVKPRELTSIKELIEKSMENWKTIQAKKK
jgi:antitoxin component of MazEF toxin-antitoxin module